MLDRQEKTLVRLERVSIAGGLPPSVTLLSDLVKFLNEARTTEGRRIELILEIMLELEAMTRPIEGMIGVDLSLKRTAPDKFQTQREIAVKTTLLNRELAKYRFIPRAEVAVGGGGGASDWVAWWRGDTAQLEKRLRLVASEALELILKLTQIGYLSRLRHCARCQRWLYAKFRHQIFCSMKCQQKQYMQTDEFKAKRRVYMRRYYQRNFRGRTR
jgi:hypothetical protein